MARRNGRKGDHLCTDDYYGVTTFASKLKRDFWGSYAIHPLKRNLQEIATPLNDPRPILLYRASNYEQTSICIGETAPVYVGNTTVPTNPNNAAIQALDLFPTIGEMEIGCTFLVY